MTKILLTIAISDDYLECILDVAQNLRAAGLHVAQIMDTVGVITGSCEPSRVRAMATVEGVASVEASHTHHLAPPDAPIQ
jgi:hypothetical protein